MDDTALEALSTSNAIPTDAETIRLRQRLATEEVALEHLTLAQEAAQRRVNTYRTILTPARLIPPEIMDKIFRECAQLDIEHTHTQTPFQPDAEHAPFSVIQICSGWRSVALKVPELWNNVPFAYDTFVLDAPATFIQEQVSRAKHNIRQILSKATFFNLSLSVTVPDEEAIGPIRELLFTNAANIQTLDITLHQDCLSIMYANDGYESANTFPSLRRLSFDIRPDAGTKDDACNGGSPWLQDFIDAKYEAFLTAPRLEEVMLDFPSIVLDATRLPFPWHQLTKLYLNRTAGCVLPNSMRIVLAQCASLTHCAFNVAHQPHTTVDTSFVNLDHIVSLEILFKNTSELTFLHNLRVPGLRSLTVGMVDACSSVRYPNMPLHSIRGLCQSSDVGLDSLTFLKAALCREETPQFFHAVPTLRKLSLECMPTDHIYSGIITSLAAYPVPNNDPHRTFKPPLPNLEVLSLDAWESGWMMMMFGGYRLLCTGLDSFLSTRGYPEPYSTLEYLPRLELAVARLKVLDIRVCPAALRSWKAECYPYVSRGLDLRVSSATRS